MAWFSVSFSTNRNSCKRNAGDQATSKEVGTWFSSLRRIVPNTTTRWSEQVECQEWKRGLSLTRLVFVNASHEGCHVICQNHTGEKTQRTTAGRTRHHRFEAVLPVEVLVHVLVHGLALRLSRSRVVRSINVL